ncbi:MAG: translation initiation factor IF-3 [Acidobacteria bacterium]|nr:translation initiation factor IF-3 [Acidobacteriota bacterium]
MKEETTSVSNRALRVNERIRAREIRLIDETGTQVGVLPPPQALKMARERGLDLVEISPTADPPVCKIMDYGKYLYELNKKMHEQRRHQKGTKIKEVKLRPRTDAHDFEFKKNHVARFLEEGDKVRLVMMFRGREVEHANLARRKLERLINEVSHLGNIETPPMMEGRLMVVILAPKPQTGKRPGREATPKEAASA